MLGVKEEAIYINVKIYCSDLQAVEMDAKGAVEIDEAVGSVAEVPKHYYNLDSLSVNKIEVDMVLLNDSVKGIYNYAERVLESNELIFVDNVVVIVDSEMDEKVNEVKPTIVNVNFSITVMIY